MNNSLVNWLLYIGDLILPGLLGIMMGPIGLGSRFQPTSISWDGIGVFLMAHITEKSGEWSSGTCNIL